MTCSFTLAYTEYVRTYRRHLLRSLAKPLAGIVVVFAVVGALAGNFLTGLFGALVGVAGVYVMTSLIPAQQWRSTPALRNQQSVTFDVDGIHHESIESAGTMDWQIVTHVTESASTLAFAHKKLLLLVVPKRVLESDADRKQLAELLKTKGLVSHSDVT